MASSQTGEHNLVFVHGAGSNSDFWHEQRSAFPEAHYLDLPGHMSRNPHGPARINPDAGFDCSIEMYADYVASHIDQAGLGSVILNGHSMGGAITLTLALRAPAWLKAIVLTGTGARLRVLPLLLQLLEDDYSAAVDLIVQESFANQAALTYAQKARLNGTRRQLLRTPGEVTRCDYEACDTFEVMSEVHMIGVPTLCIVGARDQMTPPKYSIFLHEQIKGSRIQIIEDAGHMLPMERPSEYNSCLAEFIANAG
ncbi:MAG TPA: alpha/beta hydrolase [Chloroflexia bacterium]|nr:alpha/beta hydrolase [Chloroflexia bacterium]